MTDPRIAPVEDNLVSFFRTLTKIEMTETDGHPDVMSYYTPGRGFPLLNAIAGAHFAPGTVEERARAVLAPYLSRGLPFLWWTTPGTHADELAPVLAEAGMICQDVPGMHVPLSTLPDPRLPDGVEIREGAPDDLDDALGVILEGFGIPSDFEPEMRAGFAGMPAAQLVVLTAYDGGRPVGSGTAWIDGETAGLYNIATLESARGRGVGYAVTAALMSRSRDRGCTQAILHASELGRPVYERLGFEEVCVVPQWVWVPSDAPGEVEDAETVV
jgi:GNAT superfamily N-acetyltransferase